MKRVLVVDDSGMMLRTVMSWLEGEYEVALANSAAAARDSIAKQRPDLVLLDFEMPEVSGAQFLAELRENADTATLPVMFLTSRNDTEVVMSVMTLRPEGFIAKTNTPEQVKAVIADYFAKNG